MATLKSSLNNQTTPAKIPSAIDQVIAAEQATTMVVAIIVIVINLLGLIFVLSHKNLRNRESSFICNIFLSSIATGIIYIIGRANLKIDLFGLSASQNGFIGAFNWQIGMLTIHRFLRVYIPLKYKRVMTTTIIVSINIIAWVAPFIIAFLLVRVWYVLDLRPSSALAVQWLIFILLYLVPCIATLSLYAWILYFVVTYSKTAKKLTTAVRKTNRAYYQVMLITTFYLLCWLPYCIYFLVRSSLKLDRKVNIAIMTGLRMLPYVHAALNPIFYTLFTGPLKQEVYQALVKGQRRLTLSNIRRQREDGYGESTATKASAYAISAPRPSKAKISPMQ